MAELALGRLNLSRSRAGVIEWVLTHPDVVALASIMLVAAALRFWALDAKALHHDESLHAQFTWYLYHGDGYKHDPLMHGPFLFHSGAVIFFLFGDNDFTSRILPALFGTALVGMPYLLRRQMGTKAVLIAAVLLAASPTLLYVSRFYRDDIYISVWTLALVICVWRYLEEQRSVYLYVMAGVLALSFATMEITFIHVAIFMIFLDLMLAVELGRRREEEAASDGIVVGRTLAVVPVAWLIAASWPLLGRRPFGREQLPPVGDVLVLMGTLVLPQFAAGIQQLPFVGDKGYRVAAEHDLRNITVGVLLFLSAYGGLVLWKPRLWLIAAACFYVPFVLLYTTFFTNIDGFFSGIWGSLDYWLDQHHVRRGDQPQYYYALMSPLYEFLPLLLGLGGAAWLALRGDSLKRWLLFWLAGIFIGLSIAGEKMPWLEVHIALPLALVGAVALAWALEALDFRDRRWQTAAAAGALAAAAVLLVVETDGVARLAGCVMLGALGGWAGASLVVGGAKGFGRAALTVSLAALLTLTVRASLTASFEHDDTPVEMLVYTQTSPEVPQLRDRIKALAKESGLGHNLPIAVDSTDGYSWPWAWYLRDYHQVSYVTPNAGFRPPEGAVLLINRATVASIDSTGYTQTPFKHRWWFVESYRELTLDKVGSILTDWGRLKSLGHFFLYRRPAETTTGSSDAVAFFPNSLSAYDVEQTPSKPPAEPKTLDDGRIVIGGAGSGRGELLQPTDVFVDARGSIWVADSRNNRIQRFDGAGQFQTALGRGGSNPGSFNEPWSVAVDAEGFVYVADTWNHRIEKFSADLEFLKSWGGPAVKPDPGPLELFGPRDIVIAGDGSLWVTDTGNKRLIHYSREGEPLDVFGRAGSGASEFAEPVGLALGPAQEVYVADTWNGRIQRLAGDAPTIIRTGWASHDVLAKPYVAVLSDGRVLASEPAKGLLLLFDAEGAPVGQWKPEADAQPVGVAALPDGGFVFSDARRNQVQVVPGTLVERLFR